MTKFCIYDPAENKTVDRIEVNYSEPFGSQIYYGDRLFTQESLDGVLSSGVEINQMLSKDLDWLEAEEEEHLRLLSNRIKNFKIIKGHVSYDINDPDENHHKEASIRYFLKQRVMEAMAEEQGIMSSFSGDIIDRYFSGEASNEYAYIKIYYVRIEQGTDCVKSLGLDVEISGVHKSIIIFKNQEDYNMALLALDEQSIEMKITLGQVTAMIDYYVKELEPSVRNLFS